MFALSLSFSFNIPTTSTAPPSLFFYTHPLLTTIGAIFTHFFVIFAVRKAVQGQTAPTSTST
jgi:hypothetical protein